MCKGKKDEVDVDTRKVTIRGTEVTRIVRHKFPAESFALAYRHSLYTDLSIVVTEKKVFDSQGRQVNQPASALFLVHRVILAGISFVFEFKLQTLSRTETLTSTLHITADPHAFGLWLNFVYYGDTYVPEEHAPTFLDIHQFFGAEKAPNLRDERYSAFFGQVYIAGIVSPDPDSMFLTVGNHKAYSRVPFVPPSNKDGRKTMLPGSEWLFFVKRPAQRESSNHRNQGTSFQAEVGQLMFAVGPLAKSF